VLFSSPNRLRRLRKLWICKCAKCDANDFWPTARLPIDVRSTPNAEVKLDGEAARRRAFVAVRNPALDCDQVSLIKDSYAECAACSPLAIEAVAHRDLPRGSDTPQFNISAMTAGYARFHTPWPGNALSLHPMTILPRARRAGGATDPCGLRVIRECNAERPSNDC
jgi:hypothetical protein